MIIPNLNYSDNIFDNLTNITNLVAEGGGILGLTHTGALQMLEELDILKNIKNYTGTSAGVIVAFLCIAGYTPKEIEDIIKNMNLPKLMDTACIDLPGLMEGNFFSILILAGSVIDLRNFFYKLGLCYGDVVRKWFSELLNKKGFNSDITVAQFASRTHKGFYIPVTNMSYGRTEIISFKNKGHFKLVDVLVAAMSIHGIYRPVEIEGNLYNDGGLFAIYPINLFDDLNIEGNTIGLMLNSKEEILNPKRLSNDNGIELLANVITTLRAGQLYNDFKNQKNIDRTIFMDTFGYSILDFGMSKDNQTKLIESGKTAVRNYFGMM